MPCRDFPHFPRILPRGLERFNEVGYEGLHPMIRRARPPVTRSARLLCASILALTASLVRVPGALHMRPAQPSAAGEEIPVESMSTAIARGRPQDALESYEAAQAAKPPSIEARILHARLLTISGQAAGG